MDAKLRKKLWRKIDKHTERCLFDWADVGEGTNIDAAKVSARALLESVESAVDLALAGGGDK
jgi:hypothetical protein